MIGNFDDVAPSRCSSVPRPADRLATGVGRRQPAGHRGAEGRRAGTTPTSGGAVATLPTIFSHRDVGNTDCPGNVAYGLMDEIRETAAHFSGPPRPEDLILALQGGAIYDRWQTIGGLGSALGAPTSPEATGDGESRYVNFEKGAMYWSPATGPQTVTGAIYDAWASLGYERGALGLPTSFGISRAAMGQAELPARHAELRPAQWTGQPGDRRCGRGIAAAGRDRTAGAARAVLARRTGGLTIARRVTPNRPGEYQRSSTRATPSSVFGVVTSSAAASASGFALPIATPRPARSSIGTSLGMSPVATQSASLMPSGPAISAMPAALFTPTGTISIKPLLVE